MLRAKISGAKARCEALGASHCRPNNSTFVGYEVVRGILHSVGHTVFLICSRWVHNLFSYARSNDYDGQKEYWVKVKETGKRTTESSHEEKHIQEKQAPVSVGLVMLKLFGYFPE